MAPVVSLPDPELIESEACAWIAQVDGAAMSEGDIAALKEWIGRSPHHKRTFERVAARFVALNGVFSEPRPARAKTSKSAGMVDWMRGHLLGVAAMGAAAAAVAAILILSAPPAELAPVGPPVGVYASNVGERRVVELADGSQVTLNTHSRVDVRLGPDERSVHLAYGEALFEVAKDTARPFRVYTDKGVVRAVGTVFSVRVRERDVEVMVKEGTVELAPNRMETAVTPGAGPVAVAAVTTRLGSGKRAAFNEQAQTVTAIDQKTMDRKLSWRDGVLIFDVDPLRDVVDEVSRYTDTKIVISDPSILNIPIGGNFRVGETEALLDALERGFGIKVDRVGDDLVYLSAKV